MEHFSCSILETQNTVLGTNSSFNFLTDEQADIYIMILGIISRVTISKYKLII
jgi:hypothetical protein